VGRSSSGLRGRSESGSSLGSGFRMATSSRTTPEPCRTSACKDMTRRTTSSRSGAVGGFLRQDLMVLSNESATWVKSSASIDGGPSESVRSMESIMRDKKLTGSLFGMARLPRLPMVFGSEDVKEKLEHIGVELQEPQAQVEACRRGRRKLFDPHDLGRAGHGRRVGHQEVQAQERAHGKSAIGVDAHAAEAGIDRSKRRDRETLLCGPGEDPTRIFRYLRRSGVTPLRGGLDEANCQVPRLRPPRAVATKNVKEHFDGVGIEMNKPKADLVGRGSPAAERNDSRDLGRAEHPWTAGGAKLDRQL
jgi:hypothetical protein